MASKVPNVHKPTKHSVSSEKLDALKSTKKPKLVSYSTETITTKDARNQVIVGGSDGILYPSLSESLHELYNAIASVAAKPKTKGPEKSSQNHST